MIPSACAHSFTLNLARTFRIQIKGCYPETAEVARISCAQRLKRAPAAQALSARHNKSRGIPTFATFGRETMSINTLAVCYGNVNVS